MSMKAFRNLCARELQLLPWLLTMSALVGSACAFFLWSLDAVTGVRFSHPWLLFFLPLAGVIVGWVYEKRGRDSHGGTNLIIEEIHAPQIGVPWRMAPLILFGTLATHLCGGSAGREGTAVQMGGSIAGWLGRLGKLHADAIRLLLMGGVAAGFGAVFGTPIAGAVFAMEVLTVRRIRGGAVVPCAVAAFAGDWVCSRWGTVHTHYAVTASFRFEPWLLAKVVVAALAFGLMSRFYCASSRAVTGLLKRHIPNALLRPAVGGAVVIALFFLSGTPDFLGLGVWSRDPSSTTLTSFFTAPETHPWSWLWKLAFTVATLGAGFKGGEVTPLFFIGAALGNALAALLGAPQDLLAALGFVSVFAGSTNTPIACAILGMELFGFGHAGYLALACFVACIVSGDGSIYPTQRKPNQ